MQLQVAQLNLTAEYPLEAICSLQNLASVAKKLNVNMEITAELDRVCKH